MNANWPNLNWKEIELLAAEIAPELEGLFVDRIIVPARPRFPQAYLKGEWVIRFTGRRTERAFLISVRARHPYFNLLGEKGPQASPAGTRSPFDLAVNKQLKGLKLIRMHTLPRERALLMDFDTGLRLVLFLVPSIPEALLVQTPEAGANLTRWTVIARSRTIRDDPQAAHFFTVPDASRAPASPTIREELIRPASAHKALEVWLEQEAFATRIQHLEKTIREKSKLAEDRVRQSTVAFEEASHEADWQRYGDLLKGAIGQTPEGQASQREVTDYETDQKIQIPSDPKLGLREQIAKFYQNAKRKQRRLSEAQNRIAMFSEALEKLRQAKQRLSELDPTQPQWNTLESLESQLSASVHQNQKSPATAKRKSGSWLGKSFNSQDGLVIWVGRNRDENLELTFKHARGNDLWMHVRGRPGAHVLIPLQPGKSAPLATLLDAASLVVYYSGGENWGKTEVDYTFKKYVKRIKDSTEASYTHNKTLIIEPDPARLKRLLGADAS
jgi:hypothetical protein